MRMEQVDKGMHGAVPPINVSFEAQCLAYSELYDALSEAFAYPTTRLYEALLQDQFAGTLRMALTQIPVSPALTAAACALHYAIAATVSVRTLQQLESDYIALFDVNRDHPPVHPNARLYLEQDNNPATVLQRLQSIYRDHGVELDDDNSAEQADHLTVQLEFLALLYRSLVQEARSGSAAAVTAAMDAMRRFQQELAWLPRFVTALEGHPIHAFYMPLGEFLRAMYDTPLIPLPEGTALL